MRSTFTAIGLATALLLPAIAAADTPPIKPGLWQMQLESDAIDKSKMREMEEQMKNMPPEQRKQIEAMMKQHGVSMASPGNIKVCLTKEQLEQDNWQAHQREQRPNCKSDMTRTGSVWKFHESCPAPDKSETDGELTMISAEKYTMKSTTTSTSPRGETKTMKTSGVSTWLGADCGDIKPVQAPKKK